MITFIVPTLCRPSIAKTLESIKTYPGDEILVVSDMTLNLHMQDFIRRRPEIKCIHSLPGGDWGHRERNVATPLARGRYIAHIDDDDVYTPDARELMADAIRRMPDRPILFRMRYPNGITLWQEPVIRCGNVGTPMMLIPNVPEKLGTWEPFVGGDCAFLELSKWRPDEYVWREEVIALLGHNVGVSV